MNEQQNGADQEDVVTEEDQQTVIGEIVPHHLFVAESVICHRCQIAFPCTEGSSAVTAGVTTLFSSLSCTPARQLDPEYMVL